jgi:hypothetical protein
MHTVLKYGCLRDHSEGPESGRHRNCMKSGAEILGYSMSCYRHALAIDGLALVLIPLLELSSLDNNWKEANHAGE